MMRSDSNASATSAMYATTANRSSIRNIRLKESSSGTHERDTRAGEVLLDSPFHNIEDHSQEWVHCSRSTRTTEKLACSEIDIVKRKNAIPHNAFVQWIPSYGPSHQQT